MNPRRLALRFAFCCLGLGATLPAAALDLAEHEPLRVFIYEMAARHGFNDQELQRTFERVVLRDDIITAMQRPNENLPWFQYRKQFLTESHVARGLAFWKKNAEALFRAQSEFGVDAAVIVAILGVETGYGRNTGRYRTIDALTTLTLKYPSRADFFRRELTEFLLLARELKRDPLDFKGSYAGAMGAPQFMPSSWRRYGVDYDSDHHRDLVTNVDDAIGSIGNFLKSHGWTRDGALTAPAKVDGTLYSWVENHEPRLNIHFLRRYGVMPEGEVREGDLATLIRLDGENGPEFHLGYNNFYVITRYNHSKHYAMAVVELSRELRRAYYGE